MTKVEDIVLEAHSGRWIATLNDSLDKTLMHVVSIPVEKSSPQIREEILQELRGNPHDLYCILNGETPLWVLELLPSPIPLLWEEAGCDCGNVNCTALLSMREYAWDQLMIDPLMKLTLLGLPRQELLSNVFDAWASSTTSQEKEIALLEASIAKEKEKLGPTPGDWLAEAAEQGKLHDPGPLFQDVTIHLSTQEELELNADDWSPLLKSVPGFQKALRMVIKKTSDSAEKRRKLYFKI
ncbi:hypothetical protein [Paenibacillus crassostreae]|uniref:Post-SET domain-containing protein n=1 Tax=Paenibacillus crassostreae TaxID=1763538 RepID=A0A167BSH9_9BACL|nr:hypothetical protein [Paenibacillus crassostreae]AOZ92446.1 hypothetical protein LPB68_09510 [Paenibacillus crassostreae]OAB72394.1 hypothetical protein PNBC_15955 [Paenibacillus crassostreae]